MEEKEIIETIEENEVEIQNVFNTDTLEELNDETTVVENQMEVE